MVIQVRRTVLILLILFYLPFTDLCAKDNKFEKLHIFLLNVPSSATSDQPLMPEVRIVPDGQEGSVMASLARNGVNVSEGGSAVVLRINNGVVDEEGELAVRQMKAQGLNPEIFGFPVDEFNEVQKWRDSLAASFRNIQQQGNKLNATIADLGDELSSFQNNNMTAEQLADSIWSKITAYETTEQGDRLMESVNDFIHKNTNGGTKENVFKRAAAFPVRATIKTYKNMIDTRKNDRARFVQFRNRMLVQAAGTLLVFGAPHVMASGFHITAAVQKDTPYFLSFLTYRLAFNFYLLNNLHAWWDLRSKWAKKGEKLANSIDEMLERAKEYHRTYERTGRINLVKMTINDTKEIFEYVRGKADICPGCVLLSENAKRLSRTVVNETLGMGIHVVNVAAFFAKIPMKVGDIWASCIFSGIPILSGVWALGYMFGTLNPEVITHIRALAEHIGIANFGLALSVVLTGLEVGIQNTFSAGTLADLMNNHLARLRVLNKKLAVTLGVVAEVLWQAGKFSEIGKTTKGFILQSSLLAVFAPLYAIVKYAYPATTADYLLKKKKFRGGNWYEFIDKFKALNDQVMQDNAVQQAVRERHELLEAERKLLGYEALSLSDIKRGFTDFAKRVRVRAGLEQVAVDRAYPAMDISKISVDVPVSSAVAVNRIAGSKYREIEYRRAKRGSSCPNGAMALSGEFKNMVPEMDELN